MIDVRLRPHPHFVATVAMLAGVACQKPADHGAPPPVASVVATAPSATPTAAAPNATTPPSDVWYRGTWTGAYQSAAHHLDLPPAQGGLPEWKVDDPKNGIGNGTLSIMASIEGPITGTATGPLGHQEIRGTFEGEGLSARLFPVVVGAAAYAGTFVAHREGDHLVGTLAAGSTDGHHARTGTLTLTKSAP